MKIVCAWSEVIHREMHADLSRRHAHAAERVGFLTTRAVSPSPSSVVLQAVAWHSIDDADYIRDFNVGACIGPNAFRRVLEHIHFGGFGLMHVHRHDHRGQPGFSPVDWRSMQKFLPSFFNAQPKCIHGAIVLSFDSASGIARANRRGPDRTIDSFLITSTEQSVR